MGGLKSKLPVTFWTFLAGTLALAGIFPLAGFFSKDEILWKTFSSELGGVLPWVIGFLAAGLTAFYMMRLVVLTFFGENRASAEVKSHIHESPATMTMPLVILAVLSIVGGWIGWPHFMGGGAWFEQWLEPVFASGHASILGSGTSPGVVTHALETAGHIATSGHAAGEAVHDTMMEWILAGASLAWGLLGLGLGYLVYMKKISIATSFRNLAGGVPHRILLNKYYVDEAYEGTFIRPGYRLSKNILWKVVDAGLIDGLLVNGSALVVAMTGSMLRLFQNGMVRFYAWSFTIGVTVFVLYLSFSG